MEPSGLIFVALAVAWGAYLVPKVLKHHEESRARSVDSFSERMRVVARRDAVSRRDSRLLIAPTLNQTRPASTSAADLLAGLSGGSAAGGSAAGDSISLEVGSQTGVDSRRREARRSAARRRRNVLATLLLTLAITMGFAGFQVISWWYVAIPATLMVAWLVACRLMVKRERSVWVPSTRAGGARDLTIDDSGNASGWGADDDTQSIPSVSEDAAQAPSAAELTGEIQVLADDDPSRWDMIPVTLPTYVNKSAAVRRTVRTIDLDSTGVWTSGRSEVDSAIAREAEAAQAQQAADDVEAPERRVSGA